MHMSTCAYDLCALSSLKQIILNCSSILFIVKTSQYNPELHSTASVNTQFTLETIYQLSKAEWFTMPIW